jgi:hypothetical protein
MKPADASEPGAGASPSVRLYHGTDLASANDIQAHGLDAARAAAFNGSGDFWATTDLAAADVFAQVNPANGVPARLAFDLPLAVLHGLLGSPGPAALQHGNDLYQFLPRGFPTLNRHMTNLQVASPVP